MVNLFSATGVSPINLDIRYLLESWMEHPVSQAKPSMLGLVTQRINPLSVHYVRISDLGHKMATQKGVSYV